MKILFVVIPEKGHLNPMIGVAQHLRDRGHKVAFFAGADIGEQLAAAGLGNQLGSAVPLPPADANRGAEFAKQIRDAKWLRQWIEKLLLEESMLALPAIREAISDFSPDVVVIDPMVYPAAIAADEQHVPWASISNSLNPVLTSDIQSELLDTVKGLADRRAEIFANHGMPDARFSGCDLLSPHLTIAFTTEEFVGPRKDVHLVGPSRPIGDRGDEAPFPWVRLQGGPKAFVSFGSQIYHQPEMFKKVFAACELLDVQVIAAVNCLLDQPGLLPIPKHVLAVGYAPQLALLKEVDLMITHGGANSVMESLAAGVPVLVSPICNDQFHQAWFVERRGVGARLDLAGAEIGEIHSVCHRLLNDREIRAAAGTVAESYAVDGAARAASLIESCVWK